MVTKKKTRETAREEVSVKMHETVREARARCEEGRQSDARENVDSSQQQERTEVVQQSTQVQKRLVATIAECEALCRGVGNSFLVGKAWRRSDDVAWKRDESGDDRGGEGCLKRNDEEKEVNTSTVEERGVEAWREVPDMRVGG